MVDLWGPGAFGAADAAAARPAYTPTNGAGDPDTFYQDCSSPAEDDGTEWKSAALNMMLAQLRQVVRLSSVTASNLDDSLLARALAAGSLTYVVATGSANAWVLAPNPTIPSYAAGRVLWVVAPATNTSTTVSGNISGRGSRPVKKRDGSDPAVGDLVSGTIYPTIDDGTNIRIITPLNSDIAAPALDFFEMLTAGTQNVPNVTVTEVNDFTVTQSRPSDAVFSAGGKITIGAKTAGVWNYSQGYTPGQSGGAPSTTQAYLFKNGVSAGHRTDQATFCANAGCVRVVAGDVLSMAVYQNSGGARPNRWATASPPDSYFNLYRISK